MTFDSATTVWEFRPVELAGGLRPFEALTQRGESPGVLCFARNADETCVLVDYSHNSQGP